MVKENSLRIIRKLMFRLLLIQIVYAAVATLNGIVSSYFASNFLGVDAMSAVGLFGPIQTLMGAISFILSSGCSIICGKYLGANKKDKLQNNFSLGIVLSIIVGIIFIVILLVLSLFDLTGFFTSSLVLRKLFNEYILGQVIGILPFMLGSILPVYLSIEDKSKITFRASLIYIISNIVLNYVFVQLLDMQAFGLSLASSIGLWIFFITELIYFLTPKSLLKLRFKNINWVESKDIFRIGLPTAGVSLYMTFRGLIVNKMLEVYTGSNGISAFNAANNLLSLFWAPTTGMIAVIRLQMSIAVGEQDRQGLINIIKVGFKFFLPIILLEVLLLNVFSVPLSTLFFKDTGSVVFKMMVLGVRIIPFSMPLGLIELFFNTLNLTLDRHRYVHIVSFFDGVVNIAVFTILFTKSLGVLAAYLALVINGVICTLFIALYEVYKTKKLSLKIEDLMVIPSDFGVDSNNRIDISIRSLDSVINISERIQKFCLDRNIDEKRAYLAALCMEEMAGNVVEHGFNKDKKEHSIDIRVTYKDDSLLMRIKDDCIPFNPTERLKLTDESDPLSNIGIKMVYKISKDIEYHNVLGLNVLTIKL